MLSKMDRASRARWQQAAARKREWYVRPAMRFGRVWAGRSMGVVADVRFGHKCLLDLAKSGAPYDEFWWA